MENDPNDIKPDDMDFDETNPSEMDSEDIAPHERNTNIAITIVVVVGILLGALLLFNSPAEDMAPATPGPGTPQISQPIATPPTAVQPTTIPPTAIQPTAIPPTAVQPTVPPAQPGSVQNVNWQWVSVTEQSTGQTTTVSNPQQYTIAFTADVYVNGNADCNSFTGTYSENNGFTISITTMTRAACPEGSLDQQYLQLLESVAAGGLDGSGNLALETAGGAQRMLFQNGGPAQ